MRRAVISQHAHSRSFCRHRYHAKPATRGTTACWPRIGEVSTRMYAPESMHVYQRDSDTVGGQSERARGMIECSHSIWRNKNRHVIALSAHGELVNIGVG